MLILIITIPFGLQAFKLASYALWPFGRATVRGGHAPVGREIVPTDEVGAAGFEVQA
jgi:hypothetical protein